MASRERRAVVLANRLPFPLDDGWKLRTYHVVRGIARNASTSLFVFHQGADHVLEDFRGSLGVPLQIVAIPPPRHLRIVNLIRGALTSTPVYLYDLKSSLLSAALKPFESGDQLDLAVSELTCMYPYLARVRAKRKVVDTHNIDSLVLRRYAQNLKGFHRRIYAQVTARKLARLERDVFADADLTIVCSEEEQRLLETTVPASRVCVVPNGVDTDSIVAGKTEVVKRDRLVFTGLMDYRPNVDAVLYFAESILPRLRVQHPDIELLVVGRRPDPCLEKLALREPAVRVTGRVDDVRPYLESAAVVVIPLRFGGGTRLKILEALAVGRPVVTTAMGAEGLRLQSGQDLLVADEPETFARAVLDLLRDPVKADAIGRRGQSTVERLYSWRVIEPRLIESLGWSQ